MGMLNVVKQGIEKGREKIKAYHGSPHDFDKFSTEHMGSGEGAQAYGRGLYFAQREGTAKSYRDALSTTGYKSSSGKELKDMPSSYGFANLMDEMRRSNRSDEDVVKMLRSEADKDDIYPFPENKKRSKAARKLADKLEQGKIVYKSDGKMYEVDIDASPDELLDYDTLLKDQPKDIQDKVFSAMEADLDKKITAEDVKRMDELIESNPLLTPHKDKLRLKEEPSLRERMLNYNGAQIMNMFAMHSPKKQADRIKDAGIKGIKYADAQTRFSPKGKTHNYVIFDDKLIEISRKYGIPPVMASAVIAGTMSPEQAQAQTESTARQDMTRRERRANPPSEVLRNYSVGQAGKAIGEMGLGVVQGLGEGLDFFNSANIQRSVMGLPQITPAQDALSPITNIRLLEDNEGRDNARTIGSLFSPI